MKSVSPRQAARALGASESSLKRWCDQGLIATTKTAGGHRRLTVDSVTEFLRQTARRPVRPELLGLPAMSGQGERTLRRAADDFYRALTAEDDARCREVVFDLHLAGHRASRISDEVIAPSFRRLGAGWECREVEIYQERRACDRCMRLLAEWNGVIPLAPEDAPLAIGAAPECDPYTLPTTMIEAVLRQAGWRSQSLGSRLPFATLLAAIRDLRPRMFWLSVSHLDDEPRFIEQYQAFIAQVPADVAVVVGGRALGEALRPQMEFAAFGDNLQHLEAFARALRSPAR